MVERLGGSQLEPFGLSYSARYHSWLAILTALYLLAVWFNVLAGKGAPTVAAGATVYLLTVVLVLAAYAGRATLLHPVVFFLLWHELVRGFMPRGLTYFESHFAHRALFIGDSNWVLVKHSLLSAMFVVGMFVGAGLAKRRFSCPKGRSPLESPSKLVLYGFALTAFASFLYVMQAAGGVEVLLLQRGQARGDRALNAMEAGHFVVMVRSLPYVCIAWLAIAKDPWRDLSFLAIFVAALIMAFLISGSRGGLLAPLLVAAVVYTVKRRKESVGILRFLGFGILLSLLFGFVTEIRHQTFGKADASDLTLTWDLSDKIVTTAQTFAAYSVDGDASFPILAWVPEHEKYLFGRSYLSIIFAPIPSALIPFDKPAAGGALASVTFFGTDQNTIPPKHLGEAYWNFSYPGVLLVAALFGFVMTTLHRTLVSAGYPAHWFVLYVILIFTLVPTSDAFYSALRGVGPVGLFLLANFALARLKRRHSHARAE